MPNDQRQWARVCATAVSAVRGVREGGGTAGTAVAHAASDSAWSLVIGTSLDIGNWTLVIREAPHA